MCSPVECAHLEQCVKQCSLVLCLQLETLGSSFHIKWHIFWIHRPQNCTSLTGLYICSWPQEVVTEVNFNPCGLWVSYGCSHNHPGLQSISLKNVCTAVHFPKWTAYVHSKIVISSQMWPDLRKGPTSHNFEWIDFKAAYLCNTVRDLSETWVVYTGDVAVAMNRKWSHSVEPQWRYGAELTAVSIAGRFLENGRATKGMSS